MRLTRIFLPVLFLTGILSLNAQDFYQLQNRWKTNEYIHAEQSKPASGVIQPEWWSAQWILEPVSGTSYYQIRNRWKNECLHIQNNELECGAIQTGWWSAQWALEPVEGTSCVRIRNRWKPEVALHNEKGTLEAGPIDLAWWSAQWQTIKVGTGETPTVQEPVKTPPPVTNKVAARNSGNPAAFSPEHNGSIQQASVRYTDQINVLSDVNISVGTRIYFFPQEVIVNTEGLSFDPKNPPIGGQTYTVTSVSPKIVLDRPMPMMRNRNNEYMMMVVEIF